MEFRSAVLGSHFERPWIYEKVEHGNGLKMGPFIGRKVLMYNIIEFKHKLIEVSHD